jgi:hypothetical protein
VETDTAYALRDPGLTSVRIELPMSATDANVVCPGMPLSAATPPDSTMTRPTSTRLLSFALFVSALPPSHAAPADCEIFLDAAEKSATQAARHAITEMHAGVVAESISVDGRSWIKTDRVWRAVAFDLLAKERELNARMRSGELPLEGCESLGAQTLDGVTTTAVRYRIALPGAGPATATAHIRADGLVEAVSAEDGSLVQFRYEDVQPPRR